jgi:polysaccharide export outer membrane protein
MFGTALRMILLLAACAPFAGCNVDSFFDPSVQGYWEHQPTTIPILDRIDVIEQEEDYWGQTREVTADDLRPSDLLYRMVPGDILTIQIFGLYEPNQISTVQRRVNPSGSIRVPELGDIPAAGLTAQEFEDQLVRILREQLIEDPIVDVVVEAGGGFRYTIHGLVPGPGIYNLLDPNLRLMDALANAGGVPNYVKNIYIIRRVALESGLGRDIFEREEGIEPPSKPEAPVDIEKLIEDLDKERGVSPGMLQETDQPAIDIDDLEPARGGEEPPVDIDRVEKRPQARDARGGTWIYLEGRGEWVRIQPQEAEEAEGPPAEAPGEPPQFAESIIRIPYQRLEKGESKYNIVIRPRDRIYVEPPPQGFVFIDGQIARSGTYGLAPNADFTLDRLIAAAGGLTPLAVPERVDLVRKVGENREAVIRVNLGAIRQRTEPDIRLKPDDHIIIGTNWFAYPLAVIRNGFRATYGFGFLLDRNFGNDVFGAPPTNIVGR